MKLRVVLTLLSLCLWSASVHAHRSDEEAREELARQQGQLISDVQALQIEIAQLRDLVERQQYELSKFQRGQHNRGAAMGNASSGQPQYMPTEQGLVLVPPSNQVATPPRTAQNVPSTAQGANTDTVQAGVNGAQNMPVDPNASPDFPPVEERRIGYGTTSTVVGTTQGESQVGNFPSNSTASVLTPQPIEQVPAASAGTAGGGVIPLPSGTGAPNNGSGGSSQQAAQNSQVQASGSEGAVEQDAISASLDEAELYQRAFELLRQSKHAEAVEVFSEQIKAFPYGDYADDANYWIAESKYVNRDLAGSKKYFKVILDEYKQSPRLPDAMLKIAYIEQEQGNLIEARLLLQEVLQFHPRSNAAISAKNRLAELDS